MLKRTLSIILTIAMLCTMLPAFALAEEAVVENEEIIVAEEELDLVPMAAFDTGLLVDEEGVQQPEGIVIPETIENYNINKLKDKPANVSLPSSELLTYVLVDSDNANYSNFAAEFEGAWATGSNLWNPWIEVSGVNTRRSSSTTALSKHTAKIFVPGEGEEEKTFQVVTMTIRTNEEVAPERYAVDGLPSKRGALVWVDEKPVAANIENGHDILGNIQSHLLWVEKGFVDWSTLASSYYVWEWGPTVKLTPGWHTVEFMPAGGSSGGRVPGLILTEAVGYDWSKVVPFHKEGYTFENSYSKTQQRFNNSFGAAGYLDFVGPEFKTDFVADDELTTATTLVFEIPEATDMAEEKLGSGSYIESAYSFAPIEYKAYMGEKELEIVDGFVTIEGLAPASECEVTVTATDMLGNVTEEVVKLSTAGADKLNYAFFGADAKINNVTKLADATDKISLEWTAAIAGIAEVAEPVITYNVYVDGVLKGENLAEPKYTIEGLEVNKTYAVKIVTCSDGVEAAEGAIASALEMAASTARDPELTVAEKTATSVVLEASSMMDPSAFTFEIAEAWLNGEKADASIEGNKITVEGLIAGASNTIKIVTKEAQIPDGEPTEVVYPMISVEAPDAGEFTLTDDDCVSVAGSMPTPICFETMGSKWPVHATDGNSASPTYWGTAEFWDSRSGNNLNLTISVPESGNYYAVALLYTYNAARYLTASVNGTDIGYDFSKGDTSLLHFDVAPNAVALKSGTATVTLKANGGDPTRTHFFGFVPESAAYDADGNLLVEGDVFASIKEFVATKFTSRQAILDYYITPDLLSADSLSVKVLSDTSAVVQWKPTTKALEADEITYGVYLDGKLVASVDKNDVPQYVFNDLTPGTHTVKVDANEKYAQTIKFVVSKLSGTVDPDNAIAFDEVTTLEQVKVKVTNIDENAKKVNVLVVTFKDNKVISDIVIKPITVKHGTVEEVITFDEAITDTTVIAHNNTVDSETKTTKIFIVDAGLIPVL